MEERPLLLTVWGADITFADEAGWSRVKAHTERVAGEYGLGTVWIKSNFRQVIQDSELNRLVQESGDSWWHGFQHGIALIGHAAPVAWIHGLKTVYIASSYPEAMKGHYTCASDPLIDDHVHYCGCGTVHDGYELDRQGKVRYLVQQKAEAGRAANLRVCWESSGGGNCCHCEKCYRTILELVSEGADPNEWGFSWGDQEIDRCRRDMQGRICQPQFNVNQFYLPISKAMLKNKDRIAGFGRYKWLIGMDFARFNDFPLKRLRRNKILRKAVRGCRRVLRLLGKGKGK